jgi:hypothetical protein
MLSLSEAKTKFMLTRDPEAAQRLAHDWCELHDTTPATGAWFHTLGLRRTLESPVYSAQFGPYDLSFTEGIQIGHVKQILRMLESNDVGVLQSVASNAPKGMKPV